MRFYNQANVDALRTMFIGTAALHSLSEDDLKESLITALKASPAYTTPYTTNSTRVSDYETEIDTVSRSAMNSAQKAKEISTYQAATSSANSVLNQLETETNGIVDSTAKWAMDLKKLDAEYREISMALPLAILDIEAFKSRAYSDAIRERYPENIITERKEELAKADYRHDPTVVAELGAATLHGLSISPNHLEYIRNHKSDVEKAITKLKTRKASFDTAAGTVLNSAGLGAYKKDNDDVKKEYSDIKEKLVVYVQDPLRPANLNGSLRNFFNTYGTDILEKIDDNMKKNEFYETVFNAYVANAVDETHRGTPNYIKTTLDRFDIDMAAGTLEQKKIILKAIKKFQGKIETVVPDATKDFNEFLQRTYKNVTMASSIDNARINRDYQWVMFAGEEGTAKPVKHHKIGTYAQAGLGYYFETFVEPLVAHGYDIVKELEESIVERHAKASSILRGGLFNRKKKNRIYAHEVLKLGLGYGVFKNHSDANDKYTEIEDVWTDVLALNPTSNMRTIVDTYDNAADLGEELNHTAESWSHRHDMGYDAIDDEINRLAGGAFAFTDWLGDLGKGLLKKSGFEGLANPIKKGNYEVDKETAIQVNSHPHLKAVLIGGGLLYGLYNLVDGVGKALEDENKGISGAFKEVLKEIGVVASFRTAEKALSKPTAAAEPSASTAPHT